MILSESEDNVEQSPMSKVKQWKKQHKKQQVYSDLDTTITETTSQYGETGRTARRDPHISKGIGQDEIVDSVEYIMVSLRQSVLYMNKYSGYKSNIFKLLDLLVSKNFV